ncbi:unnamed protein product [Paramecium pentaurelia]|uniref:WD40-repeat-containing domain n=1 Tax=Paramecium pentaurelia TaxID=43138 RepID=A0A8S1XCK8_9CILI|nr:unnamed protein product [Paramecium pentaurelia]
MIEKEQDLFCAQIHNHPVLMDDSNKKLQKNQRLNCPLSLENLESKSKFKSFLKALKNIEKNQNQKKKSIENVLINIIEKIQELQKNLIHLKFNVDQQLDNLIENANEWIKQIQIWGKSKVTYSFFDELEKLIKQKKIDQSYLKSIADQINQINQEWNQKYFNKLNLFKSFQETQKCEELLLSLQKINLIKEKEILIKQNQVNICKKQKEVIQVDIQQEQKLMNEKKVELKLIDNSNQQIGLCYAVVFDETGSIMVSCEHEMINIWQFEQGRLKLIKTYQEHIQAVTCLVYSKLKNNFISGSLDKTIISWQQINQKEWKCSQPFQQHSMSVNCLMLNKKEDHLISGGLDKSIKVWNVDFIKNELNFKYSLDKHSNSIQSFSFNSSETLMASCGYDHFIIWQKGVQGKWEFQYKKEVSYYGRKICFINDYQCLWVTQRKDCNNIFLFEIQNGVCQENINKTINLVQNALCDDYLYFPIIYNKDKNIILVRHKHHIYLMRELNDGIFNIIASFNCQTDEIFGTMTNNGQYLVFWDEKYKKYQSYEILDK